LSRAIKRLAGHLIWFDLILPLRAARIAVALPEGIGRLVNPNLIIHRSHSSFTSSPCRRASRSGRTQSQKPQAFLRLRHRLPNKLHWSPGSTAETSPQKALWIASWFPSVSSWPCDRDLWRSAVAVFRFTLANTGEKGSRLGAFHYMRFISFAVVCTFVCFHYPRKIRQCARPSGDFQPRNNPETLSEVLGGDPTPRRRHRPLVNATLGVTSAWVFTSHMRRRARPASIPPVLRATGHIQQPAGSRLVTSPRSITDHEN